MTGVLEFRGAHREAFTGEPAGCARVLLLGEMNPLSVDPEFALYDRPAGCSGARLREFLGLRSADYLALWRANLCVGEWSAAAAALRAAYLLDRDAAPWDVVVALGRKVARAAASAAPRYDVESGRPLPPLEQLRRCEYSAGTADRWFLVASPHPSGLCRAWNDPSAAPRLRGLLGEVAPGVPWGAAIGGAP